MKKLTNLLVVCVMMFNSTAIFAKAIELDSDEVSNQNLKMISKLEKRLEKEHKKKNKTNLVKAVKRHKRDVNLIYRKAEKKILNTTAINEHTEHLNKLENMKNYNLEKIDEIASNSLTYADFLTELLVELKLNFDESGRPYGDSMQSAQAGVLAVIGFSVLGIGGVFVLIVVIAIIVILLLCVSDCP